MVLSVVWFVSLLAPRPCAAQLAVEPQAIRQTNGVLLVWPTEPGSQYDILGGPNWDGPWTPLAGSPLQAPFNFLNVTQAIDQPKGFFQISQRDATAPQAWSFSPAHRAIGVSRRSPIIVSVHDDGVIDTNTITISITNGPPLNLRDPRLIFTGNQLTFTPAANDLLGDYGQDVTAAVSLSDMSGNNTTNVTWSFQLERAPVLDPKVVVVSNLPPGLVLVSTNGDLFTYDFTGNSSGLTPGQILVSSNALLPYRRTVVIVTEDLPNHRVELVTTNTSVADCLSQGSVQFSSNLRGTSVQPPPAPLRAPFQPAAAVAECCSVQFTGKTVLASAELTAEAVAGFASFQPYMAVRGNFGSQGLEAMDLDLGGTLVLDVVLQTTDRVPGNYTNRISLGSARQTLPANFAGPVLAEAAVSLTFALVLESSWQNPGTLLTGLAVTNLVSISSQLRAGHWTNYANRLLRFGVPMPNGETNPAAQIRVYLEAAMSVDLDGFAGTSLNLRPTLEADSTASAPPGFIGYDLMLFEELQTVLAIGAQGWDRGLAPVAFTNMLASRQPIHHSSRLFWIEKGIQPAADMVWIPPGQFAPAAAPALPFAGACDCPLTVVKITQGFFIGKHEVTQGEFADLMATRTTNLVFHHGGIWGTNLDRPVENISWDDATNYCRQLTLRERTAGRIPTTLAYRLPTEAEWEYACRAGTTNRFYNGDILRPAQANFDCSKDGAGACPTNPVFAVLAPPLPLQAQPISVGRFAPNLFGLFDMHGNVSEWCQDWLGDAWPVGVLIDPQGPAGSATRAIRGGSYLDASVSCQSSMRQPLPPGVARPEVGFRIVLASAGPEVPTESYMLTLGPGLHLIANQLEREDSRIQTYFPLADMTVSKFNPNTGNFDLAQYNANDGSWTDPTSLTLTPGEAGYVDNSSASPFTITFQGTRRMVLQQVPLHGTNFLSRQIPEPGTFETIALRDPESGTTFFRFNGVGFNSWIFDIDAGGWSPGVPPIVPVGEGVVIEFP